METGETSVAHEAAKPVDSICRPAVKHQAKQCKGADEGTVLLIIENATIQDWHANPNAYSSQTG